MDFNYLHVQSDKTISTERRIHLLSFFFFFSAKDFITFFFCPRCSSCPDKQSPDPSVLGRFSSLSMAFLKRCGIKYNFPSELVFCGLSSFWTLHFNFIFLNKDLLSLFIKFFLIFFFFSIKIDIPEALEECMFTYTCKIVLYCKNVLANVLWPVWKKDIDTCCDKEW